jgi:hypothetical protein
MFPRHNHSLRQLLPLSLELPLTRLDQHDVQPARYLVRSTIYVAHYPRFWYIP